MRELLEADLVSDEFGYLNDKISQQSIEGAAWFHLAAQSKMQGEREI